MSTAKPRTIEIRDFLVPGHHDALLEALHHHTRKTGNQLVLSISEACLAEWPLSLADYEPPQQPTVDQQRVKLTLREDRHPGLFLLYTSIGLGSKAKIFLNLFNRHQLLKQNNPEEVGAAVSKMHAALVRGAQMLVAQEVGQDAVAVIAKKPVEIATTGFNSEAPRCGDSENNRAEGEILAAQPAPPTWLVEDPLVNIEPMEFD